MVFEIRKTSIESLNELSIKLEKEGIFISINKVNIIKTTRNRIFACLIPIINQNII